MASFFEKLKKGMGIEMVEEETEEIEEELNEKPPKESLRLPTGQAKSTPKKKRAKKIEAETTLAEKEELKKSEELEPEEKIETKPETKKTFFAKTGEKKSEPTRQAFTLQNLAGQEGQLAVDVYQTDTELVIQSTIAGIKPEDLDISIEADTVLITGNRNEPPEEAEKNYFYQECFWGPFSRQIILPEETDPGRAEASMKEGILTIRIPKIERKKKRKITVKA